MLDRVRLEIELLERHILVMKAVVAHQPIGIMKLSELLDLPFHRIRYSLRILEQMGYIRASQSGAIATPKTEEFLSSLEKDLNALIELLESIRKKRSENEGSRKLA